MGSMLLMELVMKSTTKELEKATKELENIKNVNSRMGL